MARWFQTAPRSAAHDNRRKHNNACKPSHDHASYTLTEERNASKSSLLKMRHYGTNPSECLVGGGDRFEVGAGI
jgi:hypothetical protein